MSRLLALGRLKCFFDDALILMRSRVVPNGGVSCAIRKAIDGVDCHFSRLHNQSRNKPSSASSGHDTVEPANFATTGCRKGKAVQRDRPLLEMRWAAARMSLAASKWFAVEAPWRADGRWPAHG